MSHMPVTRALPRSSRAGVTSIEAIWSSVPPVGTNCSPRPLRKRTPSAAAQPQPPSLVALPPSPTTRLLAPRERASAMSWPTP